jgi:soluble lytic murein transglycosylase
MMPRLCSSSASVSKSEPQGSVSGRVKSALLHAAAGLALVAGAGEAMACPGQPALVDPSIFAPRQTGNASDAIDAGGPAMSQPCAPPVWVTGGALPPAAGPSYSDGAALPTYSVDGALQSYAAPAPSYDNALQQYSSAPPQAPTYSYGGQTYSATPQDAPPAAYPSAPPQDAYVPAPQQIVPPAPYPPAFRTAIAPKLPQHLRVLSSGDVERYARAYAASDARLYASADMMLAQVEDPVLQGSVLAKRYTTKTSNYNPRYAELYAWLVSYSDNVEAESIYALAAPRATLGSDLPPRPEKAKPRSFATAGLPPQPLALRPNAPQNRARIDAAEEAFYQGQAEQALTLASYELGQALDGDARFISGLAAFRLGRFREAAQHFDIAARTRYFSQAEIAAAAFWSGRAHLAAGEPGIAIAAFRLAAAQPMSFYGTLAERQLGQDPSYQPQSVGAVDPGNAADLFARYPAAKRAAALAQLGHIDEAEAELRALQRRVDPSEDIRLLALAQGLGLATAATRIAEMGGEELAEGLYPDTPYRPSDGFRVSKPLLFGIARQESRLDPEAVSRSNARGLMQLLPSTAAYIGKNPAFKADPDQLFDPQINMRLGQLYVEYLFNMLGPDLTKVVAAYNMGPGALQRWLAAVGGFNDPILMIESIPKDETRTYVKRVLTNMWLYESRYGMDSPTLEAMAAGRAPIYSGAARVS